MHNPAERYQLAIEVRASRELQQRLARVANGQRYAVEHGADVLLMGWYFPTEHDAVRVAQQMCACEPFTTAWVWDEQDRKLLWVNNVRAYRVRRRFDAKTKRGAGRRLRSSLPLGPADMLRVDRG